MGRFGVHDIAQADDSYFWAQVGGKRTSSVVGASAQFMDDAALLTDLCSPLAGGQMGIAVADDNAVFGLTVVTVAAAAVRAVAYLNRPHTMGSSVDVV